MDDPVMKRAEDLARIVLDGGSRRAAAERDLCELLGPRVHLFALRRLHSYADAADVTQETLSIVMDALRENKLQDAARIAQFALGTGRHLVSRVIRGERMRRALQAVLADATSTSVSPPDLWSLDFRTMLECLEKLGERDRRVVGMTFYDDRTADEIAASIGLTPANVRIIRHRALVQLRHCVDANSPGGAA
jgi:RNA polymerase sigma-70 factor (ECF subfamily)